MNHELMCYLQSMLVADYMEKTNAPGAPEVTDADCLIWTKKSEGVKDIQAGEPYLTQIRELLERAINAGGGGGSAPAAPGAGVVSAPGVPGVPTKFVGNGGVAIATLDRLVKRFTPAITGAEWNRADREVVAIRLVITWSLFLNSLIQRVVAAGGAPPHSTFDEFNRWVMKQLPSNLEQIYSEALKITQKCIVDLRTQIDDICAGIILDIKN